MNLALAEMYVQGISTRKMIMMLQKLVGPEISISSTQVSRCNASLDEGLAAWRNRPLGATPYVILDARYERVRYGGQVIDCAVLVALGVTETGHRRVLRVSVALSEAEVHCRDFLDSLNKRGLSGVNYIVSDDHAGPRAARRAVFPAVPWQPNFTQQRSFICNKTRKSTCLAWMSVRAWLAPSEPVSMRLVAMRPLVC